MQNLFLLGLPVDIPKKEITIIVNKGAEGGRSILARDVGKTMSKYLDVPVVVMNQPCASGARGIISLYHSAPDGYTIGVGMSTEIINEILEKQDYESRKFIYLVRVQSSPSYWFVKADSPFRSPKDFKNFGKTVRQSTFSLTAPATVSGMVFTDRERFPLSIVMGYQSAAISMFGLIQGETVGEIGYPDLAILSGRECRETPEPIKAFAKMGRSKVL